VEVSENGSAGFGSTGGRNDDESGTSGSGGSFLWTMGAWARRTVTFRVRALLRTFLRAGALARTLDFLRAGALARLLDFLRAGALARLFLRDTRRERVVLRAAALRAGRRARAALRRPAVLPAERFLATFLRVAFLRPPALRFAFFFATVSTPLVVASLRRDDIR
jgi:hypothetical protein